MSIVRHIVERHGGTVSAESAGPGRGATFIVRMHSLPDQSAPADAGQPEKIEELPDLGNRTILVVEDDDQARTLIATILRRWGAEVRTADSVPNAIRQLPDAGWDVVVSDIGMPGADGYSLMAHIRQSFPAGTAPPVLAVTAFGTADDRRRVQDAGFAQHMTKPIDPVTFARAVSALCLSPHGSAGAVTFAAGSSS